MLLCESELAISYFSQKRIERSTSSFIFILGVSEKNEVKTNTSLLGKSSLWISVYRITLNNLPSNQNYHIQISKNPMKTLVFFHSHLPCRFCIFFYPSNPISARKTVIISYEGNQGRHVSISSLPSNQPLYKMPSLFFFPRTSLFYSLLFMTWSHIQIIIPFKILLFVLL